MQRWWSMLLWHEQQKGYKQGWRFHQFREKFNVDPKSLRLNNTAAIEPDGEVTNYLRHIQIKRAYGRRRAA